MKRPDYNDPIWVWIEQVIIGSITPEDAERLEARLVSDPDARRLYLDYCRLHGELILEATDTKASRLAMEQLSACQQPLVCKPDTSPAKPRQWSAIVGWSLAASLLIGATAWLVLPKLGQINTPAEVAQSAPADGPAADPVPAADPSTTAATATPETDSTGADPSPSTVAADTTPAVPDTSDPAPSQPTVASTDPAPAADSMEPATPLMVATVSASQDCEWSQDATTYQPGDTLEAGAAIRLTSGWLQLKLSSGAGIDLLGPVDFVVESATSARLKSGKVSANATKQPNGFVLRAGKSEIVSLAADFSVDKSAAELGVDVHEGEIVFLRLDGPRNEVHLLAGNSLTRTVGKTELDYGIASASRFTPFANGAATPALPADLQVRRDLVLWLAADAKTVTDDQDGVVAWVDQGTSDSNLKEDAWQREPNSRPTLVKAGPGGKPTLHFDGTSDYLETEPLFSSANQTLFFVFRTASDFEPPTTHGESVSRSRQLINYNGPVHPGGKKRTEPQELHSLQICDRLYPGMYWGRVYATPEYSSGGGIHLGSVATSRLVQVGKAVVLAYAYHPSHNRAGIFINGQLEGVDTAPLGREFVSQKIIGRSPAYESYFHGDMSEILIYNAALSGEEMNQVSRYLGQKYSIDVSDKVENLEDHHPQQVKIRQREDVGPLVHWRDSKD